MTTTIDALTALQLVNEFTSPGQWQAIRAGLKGEEHGHFEEKVMEYGERIASMPVTYAQDGLGDGATAYLHYFTGSMDWYITEKDAGSPDEPGQHQAFGLADMGYGAELGYISIVELVANGVELDLHFTPCTLAELKQAQAA